MHRAFLSGYGARIPFTTALVELEEDPGLRLATWLEASPGVPLRIGLALEVFFEELETGLVIPRFRAMPPDVKVRSNPRSV